MKICHYIFKNEYIMQRLISIHRNIYNLTKQTYKFDISKFNIKNTDTEKEILDKIATLVHVTVYPQEWFILKPKN